MILKDFNGQGQGALLGHYSSQEYRLELERNYVEVCMLFFAFVVCIGGDITTQLKKRMINS